MESNGAAKINTDLKSELLHALFVLRNLRFHKLGPKRFGLGGPCMRDAADSGLDLKIPGFAMLKQLQQREERGESGGAWLSEMSDYLCVSKAAVSQTLGALEGRGLVTRETDPENRRTIIVKLTGEGKEMIEKFERGFDSYIGLLIERFGEDDTREITRLIYKFAGIVEDIQNGPGEAAQ
ncbi:MAG: MarR family transcriptional regulator [Clostridiales bacterium]|nr:MarR family transcriptional regulator [Clostridiales bacterium]